MLKPGMMLGDRYEIIELVGSGGMSEVYKAKDHKLNRYVAVKVLKREFSDDRNFVSKFRVEAQSAAGLSHPNIVNVYDVGEVDYHATANAHKGDGNHLCTHFLQHSLYLCHIGGQRHMIAIEEIHIGVIPVCPEVAHLAKVNTHHFVTRIEVEHMYLPTLLHQSSVLVVSDFEVGASIFSLTGLVIFSRL